METKATFYFIKNVFLNVLFTVSIASLFVKMFPESLISVKYKQIR